MSRSEKCMPFLRCLTDQRYYPEQVSALFFLFFSVVCYFDVNAQDKGENFNRGFYEVIASFFDLDTVKSILKETVVANSRSWNGLAVSTCTCYYSANCSVSLEAGLKKSHALLRYHLLPQTFQLLSEPQHSVTQVKGRNTVVSVLYNYIRQ